VVIEAGELTHLLRKDPAWIAAGFGELQEQGICERHDNQVEICDRFWPYQKQFAVATSSSQAEFLRQVRAAFLAPACVRSAFTAADEKLALQLGRNGVNVEQLRRFARKNISHGPGEGTRGQVYATLRFSGAAVANTALALGESLKNAGIAGPVTKLG
jgi:hypothetical protein